MSRRTAEAARPDFFLVGAPKAGTTALARYLAEHPGVFVSNPKETFYFCDDFHGLPRPTSEVEYLSLFSAAGPGIHAAGEATTVYMYSDSAPQRIRDFAPDARILVMLRRPTEIAVAYHAENLYSLSEDEPDFERAWRLQDARKMGDALPPLVMEPKLIQYRDVAMLGSQLDRLFRIFDREQVHVILFDDFVRDTAKEYLAVLDFLEVGRDRRVNFPVINERKQIRFRGLARLLQRPPRILSRGVARAKRLVGMEGIGFLDGIRRYNTSPAEKTNVSDALREEMIEVFRDDIALLSSLIGRDLSHWLE